MSTFLCSPVLVIILVIIPLAASTDLPCTNTVLAVEGNLMGILKDIFGVWYVTRCFTDVTYGFAEFRYTLYGDGLVSFPLFPRIEWEQDLKATT